MPGNDFDAYPVGKIISSTTAYVLQYETNFSGTRSFQVPPVRPAVTIPGQNYRISWAEQIHSPPMNWNRWSAFFCLAGLALFIPAVFVPAMLVANAIDGPRWYSVWSGIREFYRSGEYFLAGLIACFSLAFPLLKFLLGFLCASGRHFLSPTRRQAIVTLTSWTAKYSMLDVLVIAMLILLVKVNEYVRILPSLGLYLFSTAILFSALASFALNRALISEKSATVEPPRAYLRRPAWLVLMALALGVALHGLHRWRQDPGPAVERVTLTRLTHRGELRRSVEKTLALKELIKEDHDFFSKDTIKRLMEFGQAVTTDAGWKEPEAWVALETTSGQVLTSQHIKPVNLDDRDLRLDFMLPAPILRKDVAALRLVSSIEVAKIDAPIDEETLRRVDDPFRDYTGTWHGRIFSFHLEGPPSPQLRPILVQTGAGALVALWCLAGLLTPGRRENHHGRGVTVTSSKSTGNSE